MSSPPDTNGNPVPASDPEQPRTDDKQPDSDTPSDNDNEKVREKLKKTKIDPAASGQEDEEEEEGAEEEEDEAMSTPASTEDATRRSRKRSHDESDEDNGGSGEGDEEESAKRRQRTHERKRSREISDADHRRLSERVKTPPPHTERPGPIVEKLASPRTLDRKRSLGRVDPEPVETDMKKKVKEDTIKEKDEPREGTGKDKIEVKLPPGSGFANTSTKSPFAAAGASGTPLFGGSTTTTTITTTTTTTQPSSSNLFANSKFGALSGSSVSPFGALGAKSSTQSPFGALGAKSGSSSVFSAKSSTSAFGGGSSVFGSSGAGSAFGSTSPTKKPVKPPKPFGAPSDGEDSGDDNSSTEAEDAAANSKDKSEKSEDSSKLAEGFKEQEVATGEEDEITIFKAMGKIFVFDNEAKQWKERGRGTLKLNRTSPISEKKDSARLIMRTEGTLTLILNSPIYGGMAFGEKDGKCPSGNQLSCGIMEGGRVAPVIIRCKNNSVVTELWEKLKEMQEDLFG